MHSRSDRRVCENFVFHKPFPGPSALETAPGRYPRGGAARTAPLLRSALEAR